MTGTVLHTPRLRLEPWCHAHLDGLAQMTSDPRVMRFIGGEVRSRDETAVSIDRQLAKWAEHGFGWWSFFERETGLLIGAGCIQHLAEKAEHGMEIGWRLRSDRWGRGFATEAAETMGNFAFDHLDAPILLAVTVPENTASRRVMERLAMRFRGIEPWYELNLATYEITAEEWRDPRRVRL